MDSSAGRELCQSYLKQSLCYFRLSNKHLSYLHGCGRSSVHGSERMPLHLHPSLFRITKGLTCVPLHGFKGMHLHLHPSPLRIKKGFTCTTTANSTSRNNQSDDEDIASMMPSNKMDESYIDYEMIQEIPVVPPEMLPLAPREAALSHLLAAKNAIDFIRRVPDWADAQKESGLPQRQQRSFYSHDDWLRHRSSLRHMRHMLSSLSSRVILSLIPPVFIVTGISAVIAAYNSAVDAGLLPSYFPLLHAPSLPYELTAPALALLLVFRTDASYSRYDEARKTWTKVISATKDFARKSVQMIRTPDDLILQSCLLSYIMAFPVSLKCHLMFGSDMRRELQPLLREEDLAFVLASQHRPNCLIQLMAQSLSLVQLENSEKAMLDEHISQFNASISVCERLIRTPIPLSYTRLTSRFLVLWHLTLPIILWDPCRWLVVPATFFSAATLFCIEEVGVVIEEPFSMLALDKIIGIAHENIWELVELQQRANEHLSRKSKTTSKAAAPATTNIIERQSSNNGASTKGYSVNRRNN